MREKDGLTLKKNYAGDMPAKDVMEIITTFLFTSIENSFVGRKNIVRFKMESIFYW